MFDSLINRGFDLVFRGHSHAILAGDFPSAAGELEAILLSATIPIEEIIAGGGGEAKGTQRLRRALAAKGWLKTTFNIQKTVNGVPKESISHEVDHVKAFGDAGTIALEIEWNNKDPFYDRDLENFQRLHAEGAISVGIVVTRGRSLHVNMRELVARFCDSRQIEDFKGLAEWGYDPTSKQRSEILKRVNRAKNPLTFREAFVSKFVADKFGEATTHWRKLEDRIARGVGNPCPLVLIGLPDSIVTFGEDRDEIGDLLISNGEESEGQS